MAFNPQLIHGTATLESLGTKTVYASKVLAMAALTAAQFHAAKPSYRHQRHQISRAVFRSVSPLSLYIYLWAVI